MIWPITFFAVALIAGIFGYTGIAAASAGIAQIICLLFFGLGVFAVFAETFWTQTMEDRDDTRHQRQPETTRRS